MPRCIVRMTPAKACGDAKAASPIRHRKHIESKPADLAALPIQLDQESGPRVFSDVHRLALAFRLTSYDAGYLELARRRYLPLATLDADLITACANAGVRVL